MAWGGCPLGSHRFLQLLLFLQGHWFLRQSLLVGCLREQGRCREGLRCLEQGIWEGRISWVTCIQWQWSKMINVCYDSSEVSEAHSKMTSNLWHFESCGFTCDFLLEDWQDHWDFAFSQATAVSVLWPVWCQVTGQNYQDDVVTRHHSTVIQVFWTSSISKCYSCFKITPSTLKHKLSSSIFLQSIGAHLSGNKYPINLHIISAFNPNDPYFGSFLTL